VFIVVVAVFVSFAVTLLVVLRRGGLDRPLTAGVRVRLDGTRLDHGVGMSPIVEGVVKFVSSDLSVNLSQGLYGSGLRVVSFGLVLIVLGGVGDVCTGSQEEGCTGEHEFLALGTTSPMATVAGWPSRHGFGGRGKVKLGRLHEGVS